MSPFTASTANDEAILRAVVMRLLNVGARAKEDARWLVSILPSDLLDFFQSEISVAIREKAGDPVKARKIFLSLGKTARIVFGADYPRVKQEFNRASKATTKLSVSVQSLQAQGRRIADPRIPCNAVNQDNERQYQQSSKSLANSSCADTDRATPEKALQGRRVKPEH